LELHAAAIASEEIVREMADARIGRCDDIVGFACCWRNVRRSKGPAPAA
jgi:hypothetical protein